MVQDSPGFASSRLGVVLGLEAMRMVEQDVAIGGRHRSRDGAGLQPPDGPAPADRPRRTRRPAPHRRVPASRAGRIHATNRRPSFGRWSPRGSWGRRPGRGSTTGSREREQGAVTSDRRYCSLLPLPAPTGAEHRDMQPSYPITDIHIHIQPWRQLKPAVLEVMRKGKEAHWERLIQLMEDPGGAARGAWTPRGWPRVGLINYPSPDLMGFDDSTNDFAARYASAAPHRLLPLRRRSSPVHPRSRRRRRPPLDLGIRCLKIHPPHQLFPANAYTEGLDALGQDLSPLRSRAVFRS